jgi:hypothetical protein
MPIDIQPPSTERVWVNVKYQASTRSVPFALGVTDQAVYTPAKKLWARDDPWFVQRTPITQVRHVAVKRTRTLVVLLVAALMIAIGSFLTWVMLEPVFAGQGGRISGWPFALIVGGVILPFVARGRRSLEIVFTKGKYKWTPPVVVDKASRDHIHKLLEHIVGGFRAAGLNVVADGHGG